MARFVPLNFGVRCFCLVAGGWALATAFSTSLPAQQPMTPMAPAQPTPAPAKTPATNAAPVLPPPLPDTFGRYGKILAPGDEMAHPVKLKMPFPGVGEVKVPNQDEVNMRDKLEQLAKLSDADIRTQLEQWPAFGKMSLRDEGTMLQRIQDFRDYRTKVALQKAHDMGLLTLTPDQKVRFEKDYWDRRLQMDRDLAKQFEPIFKAREQKLQDDLFREYSSGTGGPMAQVPKPKPPSSPPPKATASAVADPASPRPIAQAPH